MIRAITRRVVEWIAVFLLILLAITIWADFAQAAEEDVSQLIRERAEAELGPSLPSDGRLDIRLAAGAVEKGTFIQEFWIDPKSGQFIANVMTDLGLPQRVWGVALITLDVPVPNRVMMPDEIVTEGDIATIEMPLQRVGRFAVRREQDLLGMQVRRMLTAGRPVPLQSVMPPIIVARGEQVEIVFKQGGLSLSAKGRAMADAHLGEEVRVVNLSSNKTVSAVARSQGLVEVAQ